MTPGHTESGHMTIKLGVLLAVVVSLKAAIIWLVLPVAYKYGIVTGTGPTTQDLYYFVAKNVLEGNGYRVTQNTAETMMRGPGYVYFLAGLFKLFVESITFAKIANSVLGIGTVSIVFLFTKRFIGNTSVATASALLVAFHPSIMLMEARVNVESLFIFLLTLFTILMHRALVVGTLRSFFVAGLVLGIVVLTRSSPIFVVPLLFFYLLYRSSGRALRHAFAKTGVLLFGAMIVLSPWTVRNYFLAGTPTFSEDLIGIAAFQGLYVTKTEGDGRGYQERIHEARRVQSEIAANHGVDFELFEENRFWDIFPSIEDEQRYNQVLLRNVFEEYKAEPTLLVKHWFYNALRFWFQGATTKISLLGLTITIPLLILGAIGGYLGVRQGMIIAPFLLIILTVYAVHVPLISHARYSAPLVPVLAVLAGVTLNNIAEWLKGRRRR